MHDDDGHSKRVKDETVTSANGGSLVSRFMLILGSPMINLIVRGTKPIPNRKISSCLLISRRGSMEGKPEVVSRVRYGDSSVANRSDKRDRCTGDRGTS